MSAETIDHNTLSRLVEAGAVRDVHVIGQIGGWGVLIKYGMLESALATTRSKKIRTFKKLETVVAYLKGIGISRFDVDAAQYDPTTVQSYTRPDRVEAMRQAHEAVAHDQWFRAQVEQGLQEADDPNTLWVSHNEVKADMQMQRKALLERIAQTHS
jgi:predicted transcriptional regulator